MKRFMCLTCKRIIRVRRLPSDVEPIRDAITEKITGYTPGNCRYHKRNLESRSSLNGRVVAHNVNISHKKSPEPIQKTKSKGR